MILSRYMMLLLLFSSNNQFELPLLIVLVLRYFAAADGCGGL